MAEMSEISAASLEQFRGYLTLLARMQIGPGYQAKFDEFDIVQQTLLDAHQRFDQFRGSTEAELVAWLKQILSSNLADTFRAHGRQKRDVSRERSINDRLNSSCLHLESWIQSVQTSPSGRVMKEEQLRRLAWALSELPDAQREAIELHHLHGLSLAETASQLDRSYAAVAGLLRRGLSRLRELFEINSETNNG